MNTRQIKCKNCEKYFETPINNDGGSKNFFCSLDCAEEYDTKNPKYTKCKNCGKDILALRKGLTRWYKINSYCSIDCSREYLKKNPRIKNEKDELKQVCEDCGKTFYAKSTRKYCDDCTEKKKTPRYSVCAYCGKNFENPKSKEGYYNTSRKYCSEECMHNASCVRFGKKLICENCGKEFEYPLNCEGWRYVVKYCPDCAPRKHTNQYGTCEVCGKIFEYTKRQDNLGWYDNKKYCSKTCQDIGRRKNTLKTLHAKYGENVNHAFSVPECYQKFQNTMQEKYGVSYACQLQSCIKGNRHTISQINKIFAETLDSNNIPYSMEFNISNKFYDFVIEDKNIVIEVNPNYTHTVAGNHYNNFQYNKKYETYHLDKTNNAVSNGFRCIHIWQWDNMDKIIQLIKPKQKLYARKLQLKEITKQEANQFLNLYHLQNSCRGNSINLGLYQNKELVQVITFGKPRYNKNYQWELLRLCTKSEYYIVGGAERLFKYFIKKYNPESILSYCDISKFTGDVYERLGFKLKEQTKPQKIWGMSQNFKNNKEHITDNLLRQYGFDRLVGSRLNPPEIYGKGTNNEQLMIEHGWLPVYDCGQKVFEYVK